MRMISMNISEFGSFYGLTQNSSNKNRNKQNSSRSSGNNRNGKITVHKTMNAQSYLLRLANAKNPVQVANLVRCARMEANSLKSITDNKAAIANAKKIANAIEKKGKLKISRLKKEEALHRQKEIDESVGNVKKAARIAKKLHKKRNARKAEERADAANSMTPYKKYEEESNDSSPYTFDTTDTGLIVDVCISTDTIPADSTTGTGVDVTL